MIVTDTHYIDEDSGTEYDRVTAPLNYFATPDLQEFFKNNSKNKIEKISTETKAIGTEVHLLTERLDKGEDIPMKGLCQETYHCLEAYNKFKKDKVKSIDAIEKFVRDDELLIAGTIDRIINGDTVLDIKTSSQIKKTHKLQATVYADLAMRSMSTKITKIAIVRLDKLTGEYEYVEESFDPYILHMYICLLKDYRFFNNTNQQIF